MISNDRNFYSCSYHSIPRFLHGQILLHLGNPDPNPVENENRIQSKFKEIQISGRIVLSNPDPVHHWYFVTSLELSAYSVLMP